MHRSKPRRYLARQVLVPPEALRPLVNAASEREFRLFLGAANAHLMAFSLPTNQEGRRPVAARDRLMNQIAKRFHAYSGWTTRADYQQHLYQLLGRVLLTMKLPIPETRLLRRIDPAFRVPRD